jgi:hypothetical protein
MIFGAKCWRFGNEISYRLRKPRKRFAVGSASVTRWLKRVERKPSGARRGTLDIAALEQRDYRMPTHTSGQRDWVFGRVRFAMR